MEHLPIKREAEIVSLLQQAIQSNVSVETLKGLLDLQREWKADKAREEFSLAKCAFQAEVPVIVDVKPVYDKYGNLKRKYSPIDYLVTQLRPYLQKHGFHFKFDTTMHESTVTVTCILSHIAGHSESANITLRKIEPTQMMNDTQADAGSYTMAQRYALKSVLGIVTGGTDTDGAKEEIVTKDDFAYLRELLAECNIKEETIITRYKLFMLEDINRPTYEKLVEFCLSKLPNPEGEKSE